MTTTTTTPITTTPTTMTTTTPTTMRMILALSLVSLGGCSFISKGTASLGGGSSGGSPVATSTGSAADVPQVKPDDDDPPHVRTALDRLDKMQAMIAARDFARYARESRDFQGTYLFRNGWEGERKREAMKQRLDALDAAAFKAYGGRLFATVGDAKRLTTGVDPDAVEAAAEALTACQTAAGTSTTGTGDAAEQLRTKIAAYEKALDRVRKIDAKAFHWYGDAPRFGTLDVPTKLMECEVNLVASELQFSDEYAPEEAGKTVVEKGCGVVEWLADGVQVGGGRFASYTRTAGGNSYVEAIPCGKVPKKDRFPAALAGAVKEFKSHMSKPNLVIVTDGKPYIESNDEDFRLYRYQKLLAYAKDFELSSNPCGSLKLFCEAGGSRGAAGYNRLEHHLDRAAVHAGKDPERCKGHLKNAKAQSENFDKLRADLVKSGDWKSGATYKTKKGAQLKEPDFISSFAEKGKLADDRLLEKYCDKPQAAAAAAAPATPASPAKPKSAKSAKTAKK
ncbi:MAG: hypothetical protein M3680_28765 [Myxococcota bacterium]|nr:hypothetical protein [Myxococcota bacterium]